MALSFIQWEKYIQGFSDERLGEEFKNPGSTLPGMAPPPQNLIVSEMGNRNAARQADEAMRASQGQPAGTIAEQTYNEFAGEDRPVGGPGGGPPPGGPGRPPGGGPPGGPGGPPPGGPPMGPGGPPPGGPPMGPGGPPMGGPPPGGPPMMAHGGLIPRYQEGGDTEGPGFWSGIGRLATGAGSWKEAAENPFRTAARTALSAAMLHPAGRLIGGTGRLALGLRGGARTQRLLEGAGARTLALREAGGKRKFLARLLDPKQARSKSPGWMGGRAGGWVKDPKTGKKVWDAGAGVKSGLAGIGRRSIIRGGGALGITGLVALDPFDGPEPTPENTAPPPGKDLADSPAIRADRAKAPRYDWLRDELPVETDLRELAEYRSGLGLNDFQDRANQAWLDRQDFPDIDVMDSAGAGYVAPRQGYAPLPARASGGIIGLQNGGRNPDDPTWQYGDEVPAGYRAVLGWDPEGDLVTPPGTYASGERDVPSDIGRWLRRRGADVHGGVQGLTTGLANIYEAMIPGQQFGPEYRDAEGDLLRMGMDGELYDPAIEGPSGEKTWRLEPISEAEIAAQEPEGPGDVRGIEEGPPPPVADPTEDVVGADVNLAERQIDMLKAQDLWGRTETPAERELAAYQLQRAQDARDDARTRLYADVGGAIAGMGRRPGALAEGLRDAAYGQIEQGDLARDYEGLPLTAAAARSRYNTYDTQNQVLRDVFLTAASRDEIDAQVLGQLEGIQMQLDESRRMTPQMMVQFQEVLMGMWERDYISKEQMDNWLWQVFGQAAATSGVAIGE